MSFVIPRAGGRLLELLLTTLSSGHKRFRVHIRFEPVECKYIYLISNSLQFHACAAIRKCPHGSHTHTRTHLDVYQAAHTHTHTVAHIILYTGPKSKYFQYCWRVASHTYCDVTHFIWHTLCECVCVCVLRVCDVCASEVRTSTHAHSHTRTSITHTINALLAQEFFNRFRWRFRLFFVRSFGSCVCQSVCVPECV